MALQSDGQISMNNVRTELGISSQSPFSLKNAELSNYVNINQDSPAKPNEASPHTLSEWYAYDHNYVANTPPEASNFTIDISENAYTYKDIDLIGTDADGDSLTYFIIDAPNHGTLISRPYSGGQTEINDGNVPFALSNNRVAYSFEGTNETGDSIVYIVNDGITNSGPGIVSLNIVENLPPIAYDVVTPVTSDTLNGKFIYLSADDPEQNGLDYYITSLPSNGSLLNNGVPITSTPYKLLAAGSTQSTSEVRYIPDVANNMDSFNFKVQENTYLNNDNFESNIATVYIQPTT